MDNCLFRIESTSGDGECLAANIAGNDVDVPASSPAHTLAHGYGNRVSFFARRAPSAPDAEATRAVGGLSIMEFRKHILLKSFECCQVAEKSRLAV